MAGWYWGMAILAVMAWVALDVFTETLPWHLIDPTRPDRKKAGMVIISLLGGGLLTLYHELMLWVWMGIQHILGLDISEMGM